MESNNFWNKIWNERGRFYPEDDPAKIAGYDQAFSSFSNETLNEITNDIKKKLELQSSDSLFELGCGSGLLLNVLSNVVMDHAGTDLSAGMVERAKQLYPHLKVKQSDSLSLDFPDNSFSKLYVHAVFQYFPDYEYAEKVIDELFRIGKDNSIVHLSNIMDIDRKEEYIKAREQIGKQSGDVWKSSVKEAVSHLYYTKQFFNDYAIKRNLECLILNRNIAGYMNAQFRFDVVLKKSK